MTVMTQAAIAVIKNIYGHALLDWREGVDEVTADEVGECRGDAIVDSTKDALGSVSASLRGNVVGRRGRRRRRRDRC